MYVALSRARNLEGLKVLRLARNMEKGRNAEVEEFLRKNFGDTATKVDLHAKLEPEDLELPPGPQSKPLRVPRRIGDVMDTLYHLVFFAASHCGYEHWRRGTEHNRSQNWESIAESQGYDLFRTPLSLLRNSMVLFKSGTQSTPLSTLAFLIYPNSLSAGLKLGLKMN